MSDKPRKPLVVKLSIEVPQPMAGMPEGPRKPPLEEQVREAVTAVESGFESRQEWRMLRNLHAAIKKMINPTERAERILQMIEPVLKKYGYIQ